MTTSSDCIGPTVIEACARAAHEVNRAYCIYLNHMIPGSWEDQSEEHKQSLRLGVGGVIQGNTPEQGHQGWMAEKLAHGWVFGPEKDEIKKTHPCLVAYAALSPAQQVKDALFQKTVLSVYQGIMSPPRQADPDPAVATTTEPA
jgi:hypothetical protein